MGRSCILDPPPPQAVRMPAAVQMPSLSWQKVQRREANRRRHRPTEPTPKALCQPPPPPAPSQTPSPHQGIVVREAAMTICP